MIAWNAFVEYLLKPATNIKVFVLIILVSALFVRRKKGLGNFLDSFQEATMGKALFAILGIAFLLRLGWVLWSPHVPPSPITEDAYIWRHANELAAGVGFKSPLGAYTARRPIGYPFFLSLLIRLFGPEMFIAELFQVGFGVLSVFFLYVLGKKLGSEFLGILAAGLYALYPTAIMSTKIIMDEHLFIVFWLAGMIFLVSDYQEPSYFHAFLAGLAVGLSALFRTYSIITIPVVFLMWGLFRKNIRQALARAALMAFLAFLCALPWAIRNYYRLGSPIFYTPLLGVHLYYANNPTSDIRYPVNPAPEKGGDEGFLKAKTEHEQDRAGQIAAWKWIRQNPQLFFQKAIGRMCYMLGFNREGWVVEDNFTTLAPGAQMPSPKLRKKLEKAEQYYYVAIFLLAIAGTFFYFANGFSTGDPRGAGFIILNVIFYITVTAIGLNHRKYRFVIEPLFTLLAAYGLVAMFSLNLTERAKLEKVSIGA